MAEWEGAEHRRGLRGAVDFVRTDRFGRRYLPLLVCMSLFAGAYQTLVPVLADREFGNAARWTAWFFSGAGGGALVAALLLSMRNTNWALKRLLVLTPWLTVAALAGIGASHHPALSVACFTVVGFGISFTATGTKGLLHQRVPDEVRGGLIALFLMAFLGTIPLAQLMAGMLAQWLSVRTTFFVIAGALLISVLVVFVPRWWVLGRVELDATRL